MQVSIQEIIEANISPREKLRKYFKVGSYFTMGVTTNRPIQLSIIEEKDGVYVPRKHLATQESICLIAQNVQMTQGAIRWLIGKDPETGLLCGATVFTLLDYHKKGLIDLEKRRRST